MNQNQQRGSGHRGAIVLLLFATLMIVALPAMAAKGGGTHGGGKHGGGTITGGGTISLVLLNSTDGQAHYGQQVTFNVSTTATTEPYVRVDCYEGGVWVYSSSAGFFASYPWPWTQNFTLSWDRFHTAGADSSCTATLFSQTSNGDLATLGFPVYA